MTATDTRTEQRRLGPGTFLAIAAIQTIWPLTMDLYLPAFPQIGTDLDTSVTMVQLTLTAAFLGMALGQLAAGPLSDRVGRSRPLCVALLLYFLAGAACAAAPSAEALVAARFLQGTGAAASAVIVVAMVRDTSSGAAMVRRSARLGLVSGVFVVASPSLGAQLLGLTDWRGLFWLLTAYGAVLVLVAVVVLLPRETNPPARRALRGDAGLRDDLLVLARDRHYRATVAVAVLVWAAMMGYMASSAFLFQDAYGLGPQGYAVVFGGHGAVMILAAQLSARLARHHDLAAMFRGGVSALAGAAVLLVLSLVVAPGWGLAGFVVPLLLFTAALGLVMPVLSSTALQDHSVRAGTAASLLGSAQMVSGAVAAPLLGLLGAREPLTVAAFMAAGTLVAAVVARRAAPA